MSVNWLLNPTDFVYKVMRGRNKSKLRKCRDHLSLRLYNALQCLRRQISLAAPTDQSRALLALILHKFAVFISYDRSTTRSLSQISKFQSGYLTAKVYEYNRSVPNENQIYTTGWGTLREQVLTYIWYHFPGSTP